MGTSIENFKSQMKGIFRKNEEILSAYEKAAEYANEKGLQKYFQNKVKKQKLFTGALRGTLPNLELRTMKSEGNTVGNLHHSWVDVKAFLSKDGDEAMLEEGIKGEKAAVREYENILENPNLLPSTAEVIRQQISWIKKSLIDIKALEDLS